MLLGSLQNLKDLCLLTLIEPRSRRTVKYKSALFLTSHTPGLNIPPLVFARCVTEHYGFKNLPEWCSASCPLGKSKRVGPMEDLPTTTLCMAQDRKLTGMLTGAASNCGPEHGGTFPTLGWSVIAVKPSRRGEVIRVSPQPDF